MKKFFSLVLLSGVLATSNSVYAQSVQGEIGTLNNISIEKDAKISELPVTSISLGDTRINGKDLYVEIIVMGQGHNDFIELDGYKSGTLISTGYIGTSPIRGYKYTYKFKDVEKGYHTLEFRTICSRTGQWKYFNDSFDVK